MAFFEKMREKRWREQTRQELSHNASWSHFIYGKHWLCPYCEKLAVEDAKGSAELVDLVLEHLINCPQWKEFEGRVRPSPYLAEIVRKAEITRQLKNNPAWRLRDSEGRWYCPYCARETEVVFNSNKITKEVLGNIINHLHRCFAYDHGNGQIQPLQYVQNVLKSSERIRRLTGTVKEKMTSDPLWRHKSAGHRWACPYCKRVVESVDLSSEFLTSSVAPREVARHLVESCPGYKNGKGNLASAADLSELTTGRKKSEAVVSRPPAPQDSAMFQAIRAELDEVRKAMVDNHEAGEQQQELLRSLEKAGQHQRMMLPDNPEIPGYDFEVLYQPMATVSGDFYDFIKVSDEEIGIVVGDVSGHGMEAALVMSMVKKSLKIHGRGVSSAAEVLRLTNADVHEDLAQNIFASVFYGVLNIRTRVLKFSRAGHSPLVLFNERRDPSLYALEPKGIAVGIDKGTVFNRTLEEMELKLASGDMLVQFTDGVVEANNRSKEEFGAERLYTAIKEYGRHEPKYLAHMLDITLKEFQGKAPPEDDVTIMCIKVQ